MEAYEMRMSDWSSDVCSSDLSGVVDRRRCGDDRDFRPDTGVHRPGACRACCGMNARSMRMLLAAAVSLCAVQPALAMTPDSEPLDSTHQRVLPCMACHEIGRAAGRERGWQYV